MSNLLSRVFDFKNRNKQLGVFYCHPSLLVILVFTVNFCHKHNIELVITDLISTKDEDEKLNRVSSTHREGRAFDFSILPNLGWTDELIDLYVSEVNELFSSIGAIAYSEKEKNYISRPIVIHDNGNGKHGHVQVRPNSEFVWPL